MPQMNGLQLEKKSAACQQRRQWSCIAVTQRLLTQRTFQQPELRGFSESRWTLASCVQ
jgi:hypothetical protein